MWLITVFKWFGILFTISFSVSILATLAVPTGDFHLGVVEFAIILLGFRRLLSSFFCQLLLRYGCLLFTITTLSFPLPFSFAALNAKCSLFIQIYRRILHFSLSLSPSRCLPSLICECAAVAVAAVLFEILDKHFAWKSNNKRNGKKSCEFYGRRERNRDASLWIIF